MSQATMNLVIDKFSSTADMVEFTPARVVVEGKTSTDRKLSIVGGASFAAQAYISGGKGKVAKVAREGVAVNGTAMIGKAVRSGNYRPLAEALAMILGETVIMTSRATFDAFPDVIAARLLDLGCTKSGGWTTKKDGTVAPGAKRAAFEQARSLCLSVAAMVKAIIEAEAAAKAAKAE